ncbi:MAG: pentapeptide repeat-containing protein [Deinococcaceae bacterium]
MRDAGDLHASLFKADLRRARLEGVDLTGAYRVGARTE